MSAGRYQAKLGVLSSPWTESRLRGLDALELEDLMLWCEAATGPESADRSIQNSSTTRLIARGLIARQEQPEDSWCHYGWGRAKEFLLASWRSRAAESTGESGFIDPVVRRRSFADVRRDLGRRSSYAFHDGGLDEDAWAGVERTLAGVQQTFPNLRIGVVSHASVEPGEVVAGAYRFVEGQMQQVSPMPSEEILLRASQGQRWILRGGITVYLGIDRSEGDHCAPHVYVDHLVDIGHAGQQLVLTANQHSCSCRMTPAVHESSVQEIFQASPDVEWLYLLRMGRSKVDPVTGEAIP